MRTPFFSGYDVSRSKNLIDNKIINLYPEVVEGKDGKAIGALYLTPGLTRKAEIGDGPIRALHVATFPENPTLFVVSGEELYRVPSDFSAAALIGNVGQAKTPAQMIDNGAQLQTASGNAAFVYQPKATPLFEPIALPFTATSPISLAQQDGFGVMNQAGTPFWWQSNLLDLSIWDALNFADANTNPDNVVAIAQIRREMYLIKETNTEIWYNAGTPGFVFARNPNLIIEHGTIAPNSVAKSNESLLWLSRSETGEGVVVQIDGYRAKRVSHHGLETIFQSYPRIDDARAYCKQENGHYQYVITFPSADATWVYDLTTSSLLGVPVWYQIASFDEDGIFHRHWGNCFAAFNGERIVGDFRNGNIYAFDFNAQLDYQTRRAWLRTWRALQTPIEAPTRFSSLRIDMMTGINFGSPDPALSTDAQDPLVSLKWSDDGGHTWSNGQITSAGPVGYTSQRVLFRRLGQTRRFTGLDRIFQLSSGDFFPAALIGAELE